MIFALHRYAHKGSSLPPSYFDLTPVYHICTLCNPPAITNHHSSIPCPRSRSRQLFSGLLLSQSLSGHLSYSVSSWHLLWQSPPVYCQLSCLYTSSFYLVYPLLLGSPPPVPQLVLIRFIYLVPPPILLVSRRCSSHVPPDMLPWILP